jgi:hypothetical protein
MATTTDGQHGRNVHEIRIRATKNAVKPRQQAVRVLKSSNEMTD